VAGVGSFFAHIIPGVGGFTVALVAVITGYMARNQIKQTGEQGMGMATAGMIIGIVHLVLIALGVIALILIVVFGIGIVVPLVTVMVTGGTVVYFYILPIFGIIYGVRAMTRGAVIGGGIGVVLNVLAGLVSLVSSGLIGG